MVGGEVEERREEERALIAYVVWKTQRCLRSQTTPFDLILFICPGMYHQVCNLAVGAMQKKKPVVNEWQWCWFPDVDRHPGTRDQWHGWCGDNDHQLDYYHRYRILFRLKESR